MKMTKKIMALLCCLMLVFTMVACGSDKDSSDNLLKKNPSVLTTEATASEAITTETSAQAPTEEDTTAATEPGDTPNVNVETETYPVVIEPGHSPVGNSYFDDAAFVGDSVSLKLSYYAMSTGKLGSAQFFTSGSLGANNALWSVSDESVHPSFRGEKMLIEDCIKNSGAKKVYIMLGMNDLGLYGIETTLESYDTLVNKILEKSPDVKIVIQSMTPMTNTSNIYGSSLNNNVIRDYNSRLRSWSQSAGYGFVDVASVMYDSNGAHLNRDYCSDPDGMGVHFTEAGCDAWIEYLSTHTD